MTDAQLKKFITQLKDHEKRIRVLESFGVSLDGNKKIGSQKQKTLREIIKGRKFKNGQQQVAVIVGYHENNLGILIYKDNIKTEWENAKITNKYSANFIYRAKDEFIRIHADGNCDLTQTGENFYEDFLKNESPNSTSK